MKKMNKKLVLFFAILLTFSTLFILSGCQKKYKVSFMVEGKLQEVVEVKKGKTVSKLTDPKRDGLKFIDWYDGNTPFQFNTPITKDYTLVAKFEEEEYDVTFIVDENIYTTQTVSYKEKLLPINEPTKIGSTFMGWYDGDTLFDFNSPITKDYTLVAKFEEENFNITFVVDENTYLTQTISYNKKLSTITEPVKTGYQFIGWYNGDTLFDLNTQITQDYTLIAKFDKLTFYVTFVVDGKEVEKKLVEYGKQVEAISNPIKENCTFTGWEYDGSLFDFTTEIQTDYTLYATFKVHPQEVRITCEKTELISGEMLQFKATIYPVEANQEVTWSIKNTNDAESSIDDNGLLTTINPGKVYVYANSTEIEYISAYIEITILHPLLDADIYDAFNIMTGLGTNASTDIEINYHTHNLKTYVEYTLATDTAFNHLNTVEPTYGYYFTNGTEKVPHQFDPRNVMRVTLTNLEPNTKYIYRINKGNNTYSEVYSFSTSKNDGTKTSFLGLSDVHYWAIPDEENGGYTSHGSEISETIVQKALELNPNIGFIATAGDMVDQGGNVPTWEQFFKLSNSLKFLPRVSVAGNHEYYYDSTGQTDYKYQKAHNATPYNGPSTHIGVSGYTLYNDVLFITFDNEKSVGKNEQLKWLETVLLTVEAKYTIVMMHSPIYYPAVGANAKDRDEQLMGIFEKYCVDLVISGHYHGNNWSPNYYEGEYTSNDSGLGVNYITLSFGGVKSMSDNNRPTGYIFDIENGIISIQRINDAGDIVNSYSITTRKHKEIVPETKENLIHSIGDWSYNENKKRVEIPVSNKFYGNVEKVVITETLRNEINETFYFPTSGYTTLFISNIQSYYDYHFLMTITFADGTTESVVKIFKNGPDIELSASMITQTSVKLNFVGNESLLYIVNNYIVYVNGVEYKVIPYAENDVCKTVLTIKGLDPNTHYTIEFVARDRRETIIYTQSIEIDTLI